MKLDKQILEEKIREYRTFKSCSESTLMGLCETAGADITPQEMVNPLLPIADREVVMKEHAVP